MCEKHRKFRFITLLIMARLFKHEKSGTIGILQTGLRVTDIAKYYNYHPTTKQVLRDRYQATGTVKDILLSGKPRITTSRPDATLTAFFVLWHYPLCVKIKGEQTLERVRGWSCEPNNLMFVPHQLRRMRLRA